MGLGRNRHTHQAHVWPIIENSTNVKVTKSMPQRIKNFFHFKTSREKQKKKKLSKVLWQSICLASHILFYCCNICKFFSIWLAELPFKATYFSFIYFGFSLFLIFMHKLTFMKLFHMKIKPARKPPLYVVSKCMRMVAFTSQDICSSLWLYALYVEMRQACKSCL